MSQVTRQAAHCDQCSHEWLIVGASTPTHCAKCKSRKWNAGAPVESQKRISRPTFQDPDVGVAGLARLLEKRASHDPKSCRIYKCGMCATLKSVTPAASGRVGTRVAGCMELSRKRKRKVEVKP